MGFDEVEFGSFLLGGYGRETAVFKVLGVEVVPLEVERVSASAVATGNLVVGRCS